VNVFKGEGRITRHLPSGIQRKQEVNRSVKGAKRNISEIARHCKRRHLRGTDQMTKGFEEEQRRERSGGKTGREHLRKCAGGRKVESKKEEMTNSSPMRRGRGNLQQKG